MSTLRNRLSATGREAGYSLVEMMIVLAIMGVVMSSLTALFVSASHAEIDMSLKWQAQQHARIALDKLRREIHCASTVSKGSAGTPALPIASGSSLITIALPAGCSGGGVNVTWCTRSVGATGTRFRLFRVDNSLVCAGGTQIADYLFQPTVFDITSASTTTLAKVTVNLPVSIKPTVERYQYTLKDDIVLRNSTRT